MLFLGYYYSLFKQNQAQVKYRIRSPKFIWAPVYSCTHWLRPRNPPSLRIWALRALLVSRDRRHLFVTPWNQAKTPLKRQGLSQTKREPRKAQQTATQLATTAYRTRPIGQITNESKPKGPNNITFLYKLQSLNVACGQTWRPKSFWKYYAFLHPVCAIFF